MNKVQFEDLELSDRLLEIIKKKGFEEPTEIQAKAIPLMLSGTKDIIGQAQTGTGKTAAFGLPILEMLSDDKKGIQVLILVPTRELALQVSEELNSLKSSKKLQILPVYGGQSIQDQIRRIQKGSNIIVGTPGRVLDHLKRKTLNFDKLQFMVLDEADEMLNMGFLEEVEAILEKTNEDKRVLLFSATMPKHIKKIAEKYMKEYDLITTEVDTLTIDNTEQIYFEVNNADKFEALCRIVDIEDEFYGLVFCRTKLGVDELTSKLLDRGYDAEGLHGDFSQNIRERTLQKFKKKHINILVATDVAARGIDVADLSHVINYSLPQDTESYVHRIGRTGRAGKKGIAITFVSPSEYRRLMSISKDTKKTIRKEKIPTVANLIESKKKRIEEDVRAAIEGKSHEEYIDTSLRLVAENDPVEVIAALLHNSFSNTLNKDLYKDIQDISVNSKGSTRLFISMGKKDGLTPPKLVKLIENESKVKSSRITDITIKDSFSFLTAPFEDAEKILKSFKITKRKNMPSIDRAAVTKGSSGGGSRGGRSKSGNRSNSSNSRKKYASNKPKKKD